MSNVIEKAQRRMMEEDEAGNDCFVRYWAAYLDGARAQKKEDERIYPFESLASRTKDFCETVKEYSKRMDDLADELTENL